MTRVRPSGRIRFAGPVVLKRDDDLTPHRGPVFAPNSVIGTTRVVLRGRPAMIADLPEARNILDRHLWSVRAETWQWGWNFDGFVHHLRTIKSPARLVDRVRSLNVPRIGCLTHGDPTVANLVRVPFIGLRWIDPQDRLYIPRYRLVDVGKMLLSCWGYEETLVGGRPRIVNVDVLRSILEPLTAPEKEDAETWLCVHVARLLRYHDDATAAVWVDFLEARL